MARQPVRDLSLALVCLRVALGWSQKELAKAAGIPANLLSDYERGRKPLRREKLRRLVGELRLELEAIEEALGFVAKIRHLVAPAPSDRRGRADDRRAIQRAGRGKGGETAWTPRRRSSTRPALANPAQPVGAVSVELDRQHLPAAVAQLRLLRGWKQKQLAAAAGIPPSSISNYERGTRAPSRKTFAALAAAAGVSQAVLDQILCFVQSTRELPADIAAPARSPGDAKIRTDPRLPAAACPGASVARPTHQPLIEVTSFTAVDRQQARDLWQRLGNAPAAERRFLVEREPDLRHWALCEVICNQSLKAAPDCATRSLELAKLAVRVAELHPGQEGWRLRLLGYAWGHVANAIRVQGDLSAAAEAAHRSRRFWGSGPAVSGLPLSESRLQSLEVSMLIARRRPAEAIELADRVLAGPACDDLPILLGNKGLALWLLGEARSAIPIYTRLQAMAAADAGFDRRSACIVDLGLAKSFHQLGLYSKAESLLPGLRQRHLALGNELDLIRLHWLEADIAAALGRCEEALEGLTQVRDSFLARGMSADAALAGLELAYLMLAHGRAAEARVLAGVACEVFDGLGLPGLTQRARDLLRKARRPHPFPPGSRNLALHLQEDAPARVARPRSRQAATAHEHCTGVV